MRLRYTGRAKADLESAFSWYEKQRRDLVIDRGGERTSSSDRRIKEKSQKVRSEPIVVDF